MKRARPGADSVRCPQCVADRRPNPKIVGRVSHGGPHPDPDRPPWPPFLWVYQPAGEPRSVDGVIVRWDETTSTMAAGKVRNIGAIVELDGTGPATVAVVCPRCGPVELAIDDVRQLYPDHERAEQGRVARQQRAIDKWWAEIESRIRRPLG